MKKSRLIVLRFVALTVVGFALTSCACSHEATDNIVPASSATPVTAASEKASLTVPRELTPEQKQAAKDHEDLLARDPLKNGNGVVVTPSN